MNHRILFPASLSLLLSSCYSISIASQYLCLIRKGQTLVRVEYPSQAEQQLFERVRQIKDFAEKQLGLRPTQNYNRYVRLDRDYLTAVVSAAPELGFEDYLWNYPFVGKLPYRGYFDVSKAQKEAARLKQLGYDVFVRPVDAFSTLGYLRDPLFSYMAEYEEARLANLIIHESFHTTLFVRGDISFNESLANLVGKYGSRLYIQQKYQTQQENSEQDSQQFRSMVLQLKEELAAIYTSLKREQALQAKEATIAHWQQQFLPPQYGKLFETDRYQHMAEFPVNNAYLALFLLYEDPDKFLDNIYRQFLQQNTDVLAALRDLISLSKKLGKKHGRKTRQALQEYAQTLQ